MNRRIRLLGKLLALALPLLLVPAASAQIKVGVFDPQRLSMETQQGKRLQAELTAMQSQKQAELNSRGQEITALEKQFAEQSLSLSADKRTEMQLLIERKKLEVENARSLASQELQLEFASAQSKFNEMLLTGVEDFGRSQGFDLILDTTAVAWANESIDVTTALIDRVDEMYPATQKSEEGGD